MASSTLVLHRFLRQYVDELKALGVLQSIAIEIEQAFEAVHRHEFVEEFEVGDGNTYKVAGPQTAHNVLDLIYSNTPLLTDRDWDGKLASSSSQPSLIATMLQRLDVEPSMKVLEIGTGTGYNAALIAELTKDQSSVTTIDVNKRVISRAKRLMANAGYSGIFVASGDGVEGYSKRSPYDRIVATAAFPRFSLGTAAATFRGRASTYTTSARRRSRGSTGESVELIRKLYGRKNYRLGWVHAN